MVESDKVKVFSAKHGVEFQGDRPYKAGDRLRDIDWKHAHMLGELIVKEFSGAQGSTGIIVADLTACDLEDAARARARILVAIIAILTPTTLKPKKRTWAETT